MRRDNVILVLAILLTGLFLFVLQIAVSKRNLPDPDTFCKNYAENSGVNQQVDQQKPETFGGIEALKKLLLPVTVPMPPEPKESELYPEQVEEEIEIEDIFEQDLEPTKLRPCETVNPYNLVGPLAVSTEPVDLEDLRYSFQYSEIQVGGKRFQKDCISRQRIAIILAHRHREESLQIFLRHFVPILFRQNLDFQIFLVHQGDNQLFNKAILYNAGFLEAEKNGDFDCYLFHDVDLLLENDKLEMVCSGNPVHFSVAVNEFDYKLPYKFIYGGVVALTPDQMHQVNGFSNQFWGWGGEDDDMWNRIADKKLTVNRPTMELGRYTMVPHKKSVKSPFRVYEIMQGKEFYDTDGLNNVEYELISVTEEILYTNITISPIEVTPVNAPPEHEKFKMLEEIKA